MAARQMALGNPREGLSVRADYAVNSLRPKVFAGFKVVRLGLRIRYAMNNVIRKFVEAHDRYLALDNARTQCNGPVEREQIYIELLKAYLEVQYHARQIAGLQFADGMDYSEAN